MEEKLVITTYDKNDFITLIKKAFSDELKEIIRLRDKQNEYDELLSRKEAASFLKISLRTISKYQVDGTLPYYKLGRSIYFKKVEVLKALKLQE